MLPSDAHVHADVLAAWKESTVNDDPYVASSVWMRNGCTGNILKTIWAVDLLKLEVQQALLL